MTIDQWLAARQPPPPPELARTMRDALGTAASLDASSAADTLLESGLSLLERHLAAPGRRRAAALELLAADALVTYAFEAGAEDPMHLDEQGARAMARIAAMGAAEQGRRR